MSTSEFVFDVFTIKKIVIVQFAKIEIDTDLNYDIDVKFFEFEKMFRKYEINSRIALFFAFSFSKDVDMNIHDHIDSSSTIDFDDDFELSDLLNVHEFNVF